MSIFDLKTDVSELASANHGISRMKYEQIPPSRDSTGVNFTNGQIRFPFSMNGQKRWIPAESYVRMRIKITDSTGNASLAKSDNIAPNMGLCATLFQSAEFQIQDKTVSRVGDYLPQIDALEARLTKSRSYLKGVGSSLNIWDADFKKRQSVITSDGLLIEDVTTDAPSHLLSRSELGFDDTSAANHNQWGYASATGTLTYAQGGAGGGLDAAEASAAFPVGSYFSFRNVAGDPDLSTPAKILTNNDAGVLTVAIGSFNGHGDVPSSGVNDFVRHVHPDAGDDVARKVSEFELIWQPPLSVFKVGEALPTGNYTLVLSPQTQSAYQKAAIQSLGADKTPDTDFKVSVENIYLIVKTVEGPRADNITYLLDLEQTSCSTKTLQSADFQQQEFHVSPATYALTVAYQDSRALSNTQFPQSQFKVYGADSSSKDHELNLTRFFISYAGQQLPQPDADPEFKAGTDYTVQRYAETQMYSGAIFSEGGAESLKEWHDRGAYYHFQWPRDGTSRDTQVYVNQQFSSLPTDRPRVLLFSHSRQVARISIVDGQVADIQLEEQ